MLKKLAILALGFSFAMGLAACQDRDEQSKPADADSQQESTVTGTQQESATSNSQQ